MYVVCTIHDMRFPDMTRKYKFVHIELLHQVAELIVMDSSEKMCRDGMRIRYAARLGPMIWKKLSCL